MVAVDAVIIEVLFCNDAPMRYIFKGEKPCQRRHGRGTSWQLTPRPPKHSDYGDGVTVIPSCECFSGGCGLNRRNPVKHLASRF
jgi:hypothetical protein